MRICTGWLKLLPQETVEEGVIGARPGERDLNPLLIGSGGGDARLTTQRLALVGYEVEVVVGDVLFQLCQMPNFFRAPGAQPTAFAASDRVRVRRGCDAGS